MADCDAAAADGPSRASRAPALGGGGGPGWNRLPAAGGAKTALAAARACAAKSATDCAQPAQPGDLGADEVWARPCDLVRPRGNGSSGDEDSGRSSAVSISLLTMVRNGQKTPKGPRGQGVPQWFYSPRPGRGIAASRLPPLPRRRSAARRSGSPATTRSRPTSSRAPPQSHKRRGWAYYLRSTPRVIDSFLAQSDLQRPGPRSRPPKRCVAAASRIRRNPFRNRRGSAGRGPPPGAPPATRHRASRDP